MRPRQLIAVSVAALAVGALSIPVANARTEPSFRITPSPAYPGDELTVTGTCDAPAKPLVQSAGFVAPIPLGGKGKAAQRQGGYQVRMKCGDVEVTGNLLIRGKTLRWLSVQPDPAEPGAKLTLTGMCPSAEDAFVQSPGFAAPIRMQFAGSSGGGFGEGKAATKPGHYTASVLCKLRGTQGPGIRVETTFTILGDPNPGNPPTTEPPRKPKKPAQVVQKPKGAAETGGGFAAGSRS